MPTAVPPHAPLGSAGGSEVEPHWVRNLRDNPAAWVHLHRRTTPALGEVLDGEAAARHGLAWRCVDDDALLDTARAMARRAAQVPRDLARRTKATIHALDGIRDSDTAVEHELDPQVWSMHQPAFEELVKELKQRISNR